LNQPPLRIVPPSAAQLAADPHAPLIAFAAIEVETLGLATAALGLGFESSNGVARIALSREDLSRLAAEMRERGRPQFAALAESYLAPAAAWRLRHRSLPLDRPYIMGILNLTEDSFSGDGIGRNAPAASRRAAELRDAGADIIDVGAESARADRPVLDAVEEAALVAPVVSALVREGHCVTIDTYKPEVARAARRRRRGGERHQRTHPGHGRGGGSSPRRRGLRSQLQLLRA
jgi:dihydropteroate synthase